MIKTSAQNWEIGEQVKVGFMTLRIVDKQVTPGDYLPDAYILTNKDASKYYRFVPHNGLQGGFASREAALKG